MLDALNILYMYVCVCTNVSIFFVKPMYTPGTGYVIVWFVLIIEFRIRTQSSQMDLISHIYQTIV